MAVFSCFIFSNRHFMTYSQASYTVFEKNVFWRGVTGELRYSFALKYCEEIPAVRQFLQTTSAEQIRSSTWLLGMHAECTGPEKSINKTYGMKWHSATLKSGEERMCAWRDTAQLLKRSSLFTARGCWQLEEGEHTHKTEPEETICL